jgi:putative acetyltransferase
MIIRPESAGDCESIQRIHIAAFANHPYRRQTEHLIVDALRASAALTVSLVGEVEGKVAGHVAFSPVKIDGKECQWYALGPVGVLPDFQRKGIGKGLIEEGLNAIRRLGAQGCVLVGDPAYYVRFNFRHDPALTMEGVPPQYLLCLPMAPQVPRGRVTHHSAFFVGE